MAETTELYDFELEDAMSGSAEKRARLLREVRFLLSTPVGTDALDREFGLDTNFLGRPQPAARAMYAAACVTAVNKFIPLVRIKSITWNGTVNGEATPKVVIEDA